MDNKPNLTPDTICSVIAQPSGCPVPPEDDNWEVDVPPALENPTALVSKRFIIYLLIYIYLEISDGYISSVNLILRNRKNPFVFYK